MKKSFRIYPATTVNSCQKCPFRDETQCTFTGGPQFNDKPPKFIHDKCPKAGA